MRRILVPIDFSDLTDRMISVTEDLAHSCGAKVWLMHCFAPSASVVAIYEEPMNFPPPDRLLTERGSRQYRELTQLTNTLQNHGIDAETVFTSGDIAHDILLAVEELRIDLIIMGSNGHGALYDFFVGSVSKSVLHSTKTPTLIVSSEAPKEMVWETPYIGEWSEPMATPY